MSPLLLAVILTLFYAFMVRAFVRQRREGVISTRMGDVPRRKTQRRYAALDTFNLLMLPVGGIMLLLLWVAAFSRTFT